MRAAVPPRVMWHPEGLPMPAKRREACNGSPAVRSCGFLDNRVRWHTYVSGLAGQLASGTTEVSDTVLVGPGYHDTFRRGTTSLGKRTRAR